MIGYAKEDLVLLPHQGYCNDNYLLEKEGKRYLVRIFRLDERDREQEFSIQKVASKRGIAPKPLSINKSTMITEFSEGKHYEKLSNRQLRALALALKKLHLYPAYTKRENILKGINLPKVVVKLKRYKYDLVLSHNDLNTKNILFGKKTHLLDWEYAGINDRYFDLATICKEFRLSKVQERYFLRAYGGYIFYDKLTLYKEVYVKISKLWFDKLHKGRLKFSYIK